MVQSTLVHLRHSARAQPCPIIEGILQDILVTVVAGLKYEQDKDLGRLVGYVNSDL